ncbi:glycosyltransferase [Roseiarcaceae bacterium H3SJ34-1]|uniref:glycosyltransferase family 4 protein n=1 Tax=Terripilifer ovatus TaxID=3032367 RepID=UPI003AB9A2DD|nr:glycosyltransferase [Roseiarcaceae bacterium H3SJ34-1]
MVDLYDVWRHVLLRAGIGTKRDFLAEAETYRLAGQYGRAAQALVLHLTLKPRDSVAWLQLGLMQQAGNAIVDAEASLRKSIAIDPGAATSHVALARLLDESGQPFRALAQYRRALLADSSFVLDAEDIRRTGSRFLDKLPNSRHPAARIYCDISDLLAYLRENVRATGIQRVELCVIADWFRSFRRDDMTFVFCRDGQSQIYRIDDEQLAALIDATGRANASVETYKLPLTVIERESKPISLQKDDIFLILGAFWIGIDYVQTLIDLKSRGIVVGVYIYDLIPVTHPQFVPTSALQLVLGRFADILIGADFIFTISDFVAREVRAVLNGQFGKSIPVSPVLLAHDPPESGDGKIEPEFIGQLPQEFVLCVCTLEARKNHMLLLDVWTQLYARYGDRTPVLVLVGKWGWGIEAFRQKIEDMKFLSGKILVLGNLSDAKVDYLYRHCLFTVFPSFVEGWGLPVGESLACGKPCIASNASSLPEVGGPLVRYIDPQDCAGALRIIEKPLMDREDLAAWTAQVVREFKPRTWDEVTDVLLDTVQRSAAAVRDRDRLLNVLLAPGKVYHFGSVPVPAEAAVGATLAGWEQRANRFALRSGWHGAEDWGCWSSRPVANVEFKTDFAAGTEISILVLVRPAPPLKMGTVALRDIASRRETTARIDTAKSAWIALQTQVSAEGKVELQIERVDAGYRQVEPNRALFVGISAIVYTATEQLPALRDQIGATSLEAIV